MYALLRMWLVVVALVLTGGGFDGISPAWAKDPGAALEVYHLRAGGNLESGTVVGPVASTLSIGVVLGEEASYEQPSPEQDDGAATQSPASNWVEEREPEQETFAEEEPASFGVLIVAAERRFSPLQGGIRASSYDLEHRHGATSRLERPPRV